jgi:hypothetical protein
MLQKMRFFNKKDPKLSWEVLDSFFFIYLKWGYHHIYIFQENLILLGSSWIFNNVERYFVFTILPFGLGLNNIYYQLPNFFIPKIIVDFRPDLHKMKINTELCCKRCDFLTKKTQNYRYQNYCLDEGLPGYSIM